MSKKEKKCSMLDRILSSMDRSDFRPEIGGPFLATAIRFYGTNDIYSKAKEVFNSIEGPPESQCLSAMLYACSVAFPARWEDAIAILNSVPKKIVDFTSLNYAIIACSKENQWKKALDLVDIYRSSSSFEEKEGQISSENFIRGSVSVDAINSIIAACGRSGRPDMAVRILNEMSKKYRVTPSERSYRSAIIACNQAEHERRHRRFQQEQELLHDNSVEENSGSDFTSDASDEEDFDDEGLVLFWWECALSLFRRMKEEGLSPDLKIYSSVISACEAAGQWQRALGILRSMSFSNEESERDGVSVSLRPNLFCVNAAISACEKGGAWLEAMELYERIRSAGGMVQPNVVTVNSLLAALDKAGQLELAESIYEEAIREKLFSPWKIRSDDDGLKLRAMDLHRFSVPMAKIAVRRALDSLLETKPQHDVTQDLVIIVGKGKGSEDGRSILMPALQTMLKYEFDLPFLVEQSNTGRIRIKAEAIGSFVERWCWR